MKKYLAGIDIGTTGTKVGIFDLQGTMLSSAYMEYKCEYPKTNYIEQDVSMLMHKTKEAIKVAVASAGIDKNEIGSLGISSQRSCTIFLDKKNKVLRPMISWQDSRAGKEVEEISQKIPPEEYYRITGFPNNTTWILCKMLWIRKNEPDIWDRACKVVQLQDYTLYSFGAEDFYNDVSDSGFYGFWDTTKFEWSDSILDTFNISKDLLPTPIPSATKICTISKEAARQTGLPEDLVICSGAGDQNSAAVGAGIVYDGYLSTSMGTAGNANAYLDSPFRDPEGKSMVLNHAIYGKWAIEGHQAGAAGVYRWFRDEIAKIEKENAKKTNRNAYSLLNELVISAPPGSKGLVFLPFLAGAAAPRWNIQAKGTLTGLTFSHDRACITRSILEGITLEMKDIITSMEESGIEVSNIHIMGGATQSEAWNQIQADMYGRTVKTLKVSDAAVLGAAIMGGVGVGSFKDIREGVDHMVKIDREYEPQKENVKIYERLYKTYCKAYEALDRDGVFKSLAKIQEDY
jgi:xylulokinase